MYEGKKLSQSREICIIEYVFTHNSSIFDFWEQNIGIRVVGHEIYYRMIYSYVGLGLIYEGKNAPK